MTLLAVAVSDSERQPVWGQADAGQRLKYNEFVVPAGFLIDHNTDKVIAKMYLIIYPIQYIRLYLNYRRKWEDILQPHIKTKSICSDSEIGCLGVSPVLISSYLTENVFKMVYPWYYIPYRFSKIFKKNRPCWRCGH